MSSSNKIVRRDDLLSLRDRYRAEGKKVGFTSGTFDLVHPGHVEYLEVARGRCDVLLVGVNSDASVQSYKEPGRPICEQHHRARVVAALACVDYVFIFEERNNNRNVELLKPDFYFKAGDYKKTDLSSAPLVQSYGGAVDIIPLSSGFSTTSLIERVQNVALEQGVICQPVLPSGPRPAVFLDRDGTLIEHVEYLHEVSKFKMIPGVVSSLKRLKDAGFALVVVTNQPGIGLGYFSKEDFFVITRELLKHCSKGGVFLDRIYFCPHSIAENCTCRKPSPELVQRAAKEMNIDLSRSFFIGDTTSDMECAKNSGVVGILVSSGIAGKDGLYQAQPNAQAGSFEEAANWIMHRHILPTFPCS